MQRMVVCAALRYTLPDGGEYLVLGPRHFDATMGKQLARLPLTELGKPEQGFICQHGDFLTRQEAWQVAKAAGQLRREVVDNIDGDNGRLYSENLY